MSLIFKMLDGNIGKLNDTSGVKHHVINDVIGNSSDADQIINTRFNTLWNQQEELFYHFKSAVNRSPATDYDSQQFLGPVNDSGAGFSMPNNVSITEKHSLPMFNFPLSEAYNIFKEWETGSYLEPKARIVIMVIYIILIVLGSLSNVVVALVIAKRKEMRTPRNLYVINLTISDITLCLICMPLTLASLLEKNWRLGSFVCKLVPVLQCTNILVSTATIVAIATDRYLTIVRVGGGVSSRSRSCYSNKMSVIAIWVVSLVFPLPLFSYYYVQPVRVRNFVLYERCVEVWSSRKVQMAWTTTLILIQYIMPILVLIYVHVHIKNFLSAHKMSNLSAARQAQELDRNRRTTILLTTIATTFAVSWLPWHVVNFLADFHYFESPETFYAVFGACHILAMSTACSNPVLYGWLNTNLRKELQYFISSIIKTGSEKCKSKALDETEATNIAVTVTAPAAVSAAVTFAAVSVTSTSTTSKPTTTSSQRRLSLQRLSLRRKKPSQQQHEEIYMSQQYLSTIIMTTSAPAATTVSTISGTTVQFSHDGDATATRYTGTSGPDPSYSRLEHVGEDGIIDTSYREGEDDSAANFCTDKAAFNENAFEEIEVKRGLEQSSAYITNMDGIKDTDGNGIYPLKE